MKTSPPTHLNQPNDDHARHLHAWNQIPWLVAGSASAAEAAAFEQHAATCAACRDELDFQRHVQAAMRASALPVHRAEPALQRLQARIAVEDSVTPHLVPPLHGRAAGVRAGGWARAWAGVAMLQAVGLVLLGSMLWSRGEGNEYRTLTDAPAGAGAATATIRLVLSPALSTGQLQALLRRHRLAAVEISADGASLGLVALDTATARAAQITALRAEPGVLLAEPITAQAGR